MKKIFEKVKKNMFLQWLIGIVIVILIALITWNTSVKLNEKQLNELKSAIIQNRMPDNMETHSYTSTTITRKRTMTHHKNK